MRSSTLNHYLTIPQAHLLICVMVFMHGQIFGIFTLSLYVCVCLCAQVTTQGHAGSDMVVNHTPQMVCVDLCVLQESVGSGCAARLFRAYLEKSKYNKSMDEQTTR